MQQRMMFLSLILPVAMQGISNATQDDVSVSYAARCDARE